MNGLRLLFRQALYVASNVIAEGIMNKNGDDKLYFADNTN